MFSGLLKTGRAMRATANNVDLQEAFSNLSKAETAYKASKSDRLHSFWVNGLLSRPSTQVRNAVANFSTLAMRPLETLTTAGVDKLIGSGSPENTAYFSNAVHEMSGMMHGLQDVFTLGKTMIGDPATLRKRAQQQGLPSELFASSKWQEADPWAHKEADAWSGTAKKWTVKAITMPGQVLQGVDNVFKVLHYRASMHKYLGRQAIAKGFTGQDVTRYIEEGLNGPFTEFSKRSILDAEDATFTSAWTSEGMQNIDRVLGNKIFRWITPFRKAPAKILKYSLERTILTGLSSDTRQALRAGGVARSEALGKAATGTAMGAVLYNLLGDRLSGQAPLNSQQRALWEDAGNREYSIRFGDKFAKFDVFGPLGLILRINADYGDAIKNIDLDNDEGAASLMWDFAAAASQPWMSAIEDMTFMRNFGQLVGAVDKSRRYDDPIYIQREVANFASSFIWSGVSSVAKTIDPIRHNPDNPFEVAMAKMPGLSSRIAPRYNAFGEPIRYTSVLGAEYNPFVASQDRNDWLAKTLINKYDYDIPRLKRAIGPVKLNAREYAEYQLLAGQGTYGLPPLRKSFETTVKMLSKMHASQPMVKIELDKLVLRYRKAAREAMRADSRFNIAEREQEIKRKEYEAMRRPMQ